MAQFLIELESYKKGGFKVLKVIHGYGSHGKGGIIRTEFLKKCKELKSKHKIEDFVCGDTWNSNKTVRKMAINYCPDLISDVELHFTNPGCSIVIL